mgnify:FL=1
METIGISLVCAIILGVVIYFFLMGQASNVAQASKADEYLDRESFSLDVSKDSFLYTSVTRQTKTKKSSDDK